MYSYQKGGRYEKKATGAQHRKDIPPGPVRPFNMLQDLVSNDEVKLSIKSLGANVEVGMLRGSIRLEFERLLPVWSCPYFQDLQAFRSKRANKFEALLIHDDT
jgi:hypothetical protein